MFTAGVLGALLSVVFYPIIGAWAYGLSLLGGLLVGIVGTNFI